MHDVDRCSGACASIDPIRCARARCVQRRARAPLSVLRLRTPDFPHCKVCTYYNICNLSTYMWWSLGQLSSRVARHRSYPCIHCSLAQGPSFVLRAWYCCSSHLLLSRYLCAYEPHYRNVSFMEPRHFRLLLHVLGVQPGGPHTPLL